MLPALFGRPVGAHSQSRKKEELDVDNHNVREIKSKGKRGAGLQLQQWFSSLVAH